MDVSRLRSAARQAVDEGATAACQFAIGLEGEIVHAETFGEATDDDRFLIASCTKPIVASVACLFVDDGSLELAAPVADYVPEFGANGKQDVTVEQVFLMTAGVPNPGPDEDPLPSTSAERRRAFASWKLEWAPGTRWEYHSRSAHLVLAELIETLSGRDWRDVVQDRLTDPVGIPRCLGLPAAEHGNVLQVSAPPPGYGDHQHARDLLAGNPGGGAAMRAHELARFYQALVEPDVDLWSRSMRDAMLSTIRCTLPDPFMGLPANRTLIAARAGGFGSTWDLAPAAIGWCGRGGHVGFVDPDTRRSFAFFQNTSWADEQGGSALMGKMSHLFLRDTADR